MDIVSRDLSRLIPKLAEIGLSLNATKCEVIAGPGTDLTTLNTVMGEYKLLNPAQVTLLGAPLTPDASSGVAEEKLAALTLLTQRLRDLEPHAAFFLLKNCLWLPKLLYFLRASPAYTEAPEALTRMDAKLRETLAPSAMSI